MGLLSSAFVVVRQDDRLNNKKKQRPSQTGEDGTDGVTANGQDRNIGPEYQGRTISEHRKDRGGRRKRRLMIITGQERSEEVELRAGHTLSRH